MTPPLWESFLETVKEPCTVCKKGWRRGARGGKARLEYNNPPSEKV